MVVVGRLLVLDCQPRGVGKSPALGIAPKAPRALTGEITKLFEEEILKENSLLVNGCFYWFCSGLLVDSVPILL